MGSGVRGTVFFRPVVMNFGVEFSFVRAHQANEGRIADVFVAGGPEDHFGEDGSEVNALGRERVDALATIGRIVARRKNAEVFETAEAVGKNVGGDFFVGLQKFVKAGVTTQHHVAENEQRPAIAQHFDRGVQWTARPPLRSGPLFRHSITVAYFHLQRASHLGKLFGGNSAGSRPSGTVAPESKPGGEVR